MRQLVQVNSLPLYLAIKILIIIFRDSGLIIRKLYIKDNRIMIYFYYIFRHLDLDFGHKMTYSII